MKFEIDIPDSEIKQVILVDDTGSIMVDWDNGSGLNVVYGVDVIKKI